MPLLDDADELAAAITTTTSTVTGSGSRVVIAGGTSACSGEIEIAEDMKILTWH